MHLPRNNGNSYNLSCPRKSRKQAVPPSTIAAFSMVSAGSSARVPPWRDLPARYGPWRTVASRCYRWRKAGCWERLFATVQPPADANGHLDWDVHYVDGTIVRAHQHAAGAKKGLQTPKP